MSLEKKVEDLKINETATGSGSATGEASAVAAADDKSRVAREHGWVPPVKYDYEAFNSTREELEAAQKATPTAEAPTWAATATRYEWLDEYGDVGPAIPQLEDELFRSETTVKQGVQMEGLKFEVTVESENKVLPIINFDHAGLHPVMRKNVELCGYKKPTPIQAYSLPAVLTDHDLIAVAQTGSGKTAAFLIPVLSKLMGKARKLAAPRPNPSQAFGVNFDARPAEPLVLVIVPTRELSIQIFDEARRLCYRSMLRPCVAYGGGPRREQADELRKGCDILIGTPGRLMDFMNEGSGNLFSLRRVRYTIIDEADEMVHSDWQDDLKALLTGGDNNEDADHRYMMFSATFPKEARQLAKEYLQDDYIRIRVGRFGSVHRNIRQQVVFVEERAKRQALYDMLMVTPPARTIIFVNSKKSADFIDDFLFNNSMPSTSIHSDRTQREREDALRAFKTGKTPILVATGVSSRGLDIEGVMHVINFDLPNMDHGGITEYIHRIGRTARIGNDGLATSFYNERNEEMAPMLVKIMMETNQPIPDFLDAFKPAEGEELDFEDKSDESDGEDGSGDAWGTAAAEPVVEPVAEPKAEPAKPAKPAKKAAPAPAPEAPKADDGWGTPADDDAGW